MTDETKVKQVILVLSVDAARDLWADLNRLDDRLSEGGDKIMGELDEQLTAVTK